MANARLENKNVAVIGASRGIGLEASFLKDANVDSLIREYGISSDILQMIWNQYTNLLWLYMSPLKKIYLHHTDDGLLMQFTMVNLEDEIHAVQDLTL